MRKYVIWNCRITFLFKKVFLIWKSKIEICGNTKKGVRIVKTICGCCWVMQFFFLWERTKDLLCSMFQWDMKNKEKSDVITHVENPTTIEKKRKKYRIIHKIPCSMYFGILEERKGSGLWTKGETKQTTNTWRLKSCALIAPIPKRALDGGNSRGERNQPSSQTTINNDNPKITDIFTHVFWFKRLEIKRYYWIDLFWLKYTY